MTHTMVDTCLIQAILNESDAHNFVIKTKNARLIVRLIFIACEKYLCTKHENQTSNELLHLVSIVKIMHHLHSKLTIKVTKIHRKNKCITTFS